MGHPDAGLAQIAGRFAAQAGVELGPGRGPRAAGHPSDMVGGRTAPQVGGEPPSAEAAAIRELAGEFRRQRAQLAARARAAYPVEIPPMIYTVSAAGLLVPGTGFGGSEHMGPRTGYFWDVTNVTVDGLVGGTPQQQEGAVTSPGSHVTIAQIGAANLVPGTYTFAWTCQLAGTPAAADADNFQVLFSGGNVLATSQNVGAVGDYPQPSFQIEVLNGSAALVVRTAAAGTAGAVYSVSFSLTPIYPADTVVLYKRFGNAPGARRHTFTAPGSSPGPDWTPGGALMMRRGDALQLAAAAPLSASQVVLSAEAVQIEAPWIGDYLL